MFKILCHVKVGSGTGCALISKVGSGFAFSQLWIRICIFSRLWFCDFFLFGIKIYKRNKNYVKRNTTFCKIFPAGGEGQWTLSTFAFSTARSTCVLSPAVIGRASMLSGSLFWMNLRVELKEANMTCKK